MSAKKRKKAERLFQNMYENFNEQFFGGRLPAGLKVRFADTGGKTAYYSPLHQEIFIHKDLIAHHGPAASSLLHEMAHVSLQPTYLGQIENFGITPQESFHGMQFQAEIVRLFKAGAYDGVL